MSGQSNERKCVKIDEDVYIRLKNEAQAFKSISQTIEFLLDNMYPSGPNLCDECKSKIKQKK